MLKVLGRWRMLIVVLSATLEALGGGGMACGVSTSAHAHHLDQNGASSLEALGRWRMCIVAVTAALGDLRRVRMCIVLVYDA